MGDFIKESNIMDLNGTARTFWAKFPAKPPKVSEEQEKVNNRIASLEEKIMEQAEVIERLKDANKTYKKILLNI